MKCSGYKQADSATLVLKAAVVDRQKIVKQTKASFILV